MLANTIIGSLRSDSSDNTPQEEVPLREKMLRQQKLLDIIGSIPTHEALPEHPRHAMDQLLQQLMELTGSSWGFIGEMKTGNTLTQLHTTTVVNQVPERGWNFTPALQIVAGSGQAAIVPLTEDNPAPFIGLPIHSRQELLAVIALAGNAGGYSQETISFLQPLLNVLAHLHTHTLQEMNTRQLQTAFTRLKSEWTP